MKKRFIAKLLVLCMVVGMLPTSAFAADYTDVSGNVGDIYSVTDDTYTLSGDTYINSITVPSGELEINGNGDEAAVYALNSDTIIADIDGSMALNEVYIAANDVMLIQGSGSTIIDNGENVGNLVKMSLNDAGDYTYVIAADTATYGTVTSVLGNTITKDGYTLTSWLVNGEAMVGTYVIENDAALTAVWSSNGGGSTGGSGSTGGESSTNKVTISAPNGIVTDSALAKTAEEIAKSSATEVTLVINAGTSTSVKISASALADAVATASAAGKTMNITINYQYGAINLPAKALASIIEQAGSAELTISMKKATTSTMSAKKAAAVGNAVAYDFTITADSKSITSFGGASVSMDVNFTLASGKAAATVQSWYVKDSGGKVRMETVYNDGKATITTTHFSTYMVDYEPANLQDLSAYSDVTNSWYYENVQYVVYNNLMTGTSSTTFAPNVTLSRAMVAQMLYNMEGKPAVTTSANFTDVSADAWYADAINWAASTGVVDGMGNGIFAPNANVTREQLATMMSRYATFKGYEGETANLSAYVDGSAVSSWAVSGMQWAVGEEVVTGTTPTTLAPRSTATRAQAATMLMRLDYLIG